MYKTSIKLVPHSTLLFVKLQHSQASFAHTHSHIYTAPAPVVCVRAQDKIAFSCMDAIVFSPLCVLQVETSLNKKKNLTKTATWAWVTSPPLALIIVMMPMVLRIPTLRLTWTSMPKSYKYQRIFRQFVEPEKSENRTCLVKHMKNYNRQIFNWKRL